MSGLNKQLSIFLAVIGCMLMAAYFGLVSNSQIVQFFKQKIPKSEILAKAEKEFNNSDLADLDLTRKIQMDIDKKLLHFVQLYLNDEKYYGQVPVGQWQVTWEGELSTKKEGKQHVEFLVGYDFNGRLVSMGQFAPYLIRPPNLEEEDALQMARDFLHLRNVDTTTISLRNKTIRKDDRVLHYDFYFWKPSAISSFLTERYDVKISGREITEFRSRMTLDFDNFSFPEINKTSEVAAMVIMFIFWGMITVFIVSVFFKRLKHDELEFKRAFWLAIAVFVLMWSYLAIEEWPSWEGILFGGGFAGLFAALGILVVFSVTESLNRETWKQQVALSDVLFRGVFRVREFGKAILDALFLSGLTLILFGGLFWLTSYLQIGYLSFDDDVFWIFRNNVAVVSAICRKLVSMLFIGMTLFSFWVAYLRSKIQNKTLLIMLVALFINFSGLQLYYLRPTYLAFFLFLPLAVFWSFITFRLNIISILISLFIVNFFIELSFINILPGGLISPPGIVAAIFVLGFLFLGLYFCFSKHSVEDFEHYVPEYVSRIAEHEQFLKELEIARNVQMRFLPQSVPSVPKLDIACLCRPALEVGGDYYDFILNGNHSLGVVIGDVAGKGVSAAFYMTMVKGIIKTLTKSNPAPKKMLTEMNSIFYENAPNEIFISMIYGLFDLSNSTLTFARAGHNPIIFHKCNGHDPQLLNSNGLAIGLEKGTLFKNIIEEICLPIETGDVFIFFTDGISEAMNKKGDEFGEKRLREIVHKNAERTAQNILEQITNEINTFAGSSAQHDDLTMVVVKITE